METRNIDTINYDSEIFNSGHESFLFECDDGIFKYFFESIPDRFLERKVKILNYLAKIEELKPYHPELKYLVEEWNIIVGYVMSKRNGIPIDSSPYSIAQRLELLNKGLDIVRLYNKHGILFLDLHPNLKVDSKSNEVFLVDNDGATTEGVLTYCGPKNFRNYIQNGGKIDQQAQNFFFNQYTLEVLKNNRKLFNQKGQAIITNLQEFKVDSSADHEILLNYVKKDI